MAERREKVGPGQGLPLRWLEEQGPASSLWCPAQSQPLTGALVAAVEELHERGRGALGIDGISSLLVLGQLTQHSGSHTLDVLHGGIQELGEESRGGGENGDKPSCQPTAPPTRSRSCHPRRWKTWESIKGKKTDQRCSPARQPLPTDTSAHYQCIFITVYYYTLQKVLCVYLCVSW